MTKNKQKIIDDNMNDVIKNSKEMRNILLNEDIDFQERLEKLKLFKTALEMNRNIVSASVVQLHLESFKL